MITKVHEESLAKPNMVDSSYCDFLVSVVSAVSGSLGVAASVSGAGGALLWRASRCLRSAPNASTYMAKYGTSMPMVL
eukprot:9243253-Pyramimonas_sp.AAC.1